MKKRLFNLILVAIGLVMGVSSALGGTVSDVYKRAITADAANGVIAWSADDLGSSAWATTISTKPYYAKPAIDAALGLSLQSQTANQEISNKTQINPAVNSIITIDAQWYTGGTYGKSGNENYLKIGDNIKFSALPQDQKGYVTIGTTQTQVTNAVLNGNNRYDDTWNIHMVINTATGVVSTLNITGTIGTKLATLTLSDQSLPSTATFNSLTMGCVRKANGMYTSLKSISITQETQDVSTANYTVKYVKADGTQVKDPVTRTGVVGTAISLSSDDIANFTLADNSMKYIYVSDDANTKAVSADGKTIVTVTYRDANKYNYSVDSNVGDNVVIASGSDWEGNSITVSFPRYQLVGTELYEVPYINQQYNYSFTVSSENQVETLTYSDTNIGNVVYYQEAENISSLTKVNTGNISIRCSNANAAYNSSSENVQFTTLPAGSYHITTITSGNTTTDPICNILADADIVSKLYVSGNSGVNNADFTISSDAKMYITPGGNAGSSPKVIDLIYIQKADITKEISAATYATLYNENALDFTNVSGLTAYVGTVANNTVTFTKVTSVPAKTPVLLHGAAGTYTIPFATTAPTAVTDNVLVGVSADTKIDATTTVGTVKNTNFVLMGSNPVGFYKVGTDGFTVGAGTAYLSTALTGGAAYIALDGVATSINDVNTVKSVDNGMMYNVNGQRIATPVQGQLYIMNGKKFMMK